MTRAVHRPVAEYVRQTKTEFGKPKPETGVMPEWVSWVDSSSKYPAEVTAQLLEGEHVEYFSYIAQKGGCLSSSSRDEHWIALTNKRMFYKALVRSPEEKRTVERDGLIPLEKISFVEVTSAEKDGCSGSKSYQLKLGSSGGEVSIPIPTREKGVEVRGVYARIHDEAPT